ncbi:MAG: hypothetical protein HZT40_18390 [Candidatus Thiothrix singaporensis]|uniref:Uncharacterized protein n=1 Tax=Candidatus Thiothrix singaporensis TaxID=2799669 RepID=A0A7L6AW18_9GAMM|nr:MAG: hypothetical protein HZT40_18390 [Candidatus Thiothrix singaporensis]
MESLTGLTGIRVDDLDNSGTLSAGDVVVGSDPTAMKHDLTAEEIAATQPKPSPQPLELSVDQLNAIANFFNDGRLPKTLAVSRPSSLVRLRTTTAMVSWV